jgi:hypothetical protein
MKFKDVPSLMWEANYNEYELITSSKQRTAYVESGQCIGQLRFQRLDGIFVLLLMIPAANAVETDSSRVKHLDFSQYTVKKALSTTPFILFTDSYLATATSSCSLAKLPLLATSDIKLIRF